MGKDGDLGDERSHEDWGPRVVATIAAQIRKYRMQRKMSAQAVSDACAELGWPIQRSVISNLEIGYRQTITVPELLILAQAVGVAPIMLVFPLDDEHPAYEFRPGREAPTWDAAQWFAGRRQAIPSENAAAVENEAVNLLQRIEDGRRVADQAHAAVALWRRRIEAGEVSEEVRLIYESVLDSQVKTMSFLLDLVRFAREKGILDADPAGVDHLRRIAGEGTT